jgi:hypothetical protein
VRDRYCWWNAPEWTTWRDYLDREAFKVVTFVAYQTWAQSIPRARFWTSTIRQGTGLAWAQVDAALERLFAAGVLAPSIWRPGVSAVDCELVEGWQPVREVAA